MKNPNTDAPQPIRQWLADIGRKGGAAGDPKDKRRAARKRWRNARKLKGQAV